MLRRSHSRRLRAPDVTTLLQKILSIAVNVAVPLLGGPRPTFAKFEFALGAQKEKSTGDGKATQILRLVDLPNKVQLEHHLYTNIPAAHSLLQDSMDTGDSDVILISEKTITNELLLQK